MTAGTRRNFVKGTQFNRSRKLHYKFKTKTVTEETSCNPREEAPLRDYFCH